MSLEKILGKSRSSLILMHPTSLPDPEGRAYGIGELGSEAFRFIDFLRDSGVHCWQILPLGHTGYMNSPYQTFSRCAGSPFLISIERLRDVGDLSDADHDAYVQGVGESDMTASRADYGWLFHHKLGQGWQDENAVLRQAFAGFQERDADDPRRKEYEAFLEKHNHQSGGWLQDYTEYMAIKENMGHAPWSEWDSDFRECAIFRKKRDKLLEKKPEIAKSIDFYRYLQFCFFNQWFAIRDYAHEQGRKIIGDMPWYVGYDSADVWANRSAFQLDEKGTPLFVAGVPPDYFSETGQLWGNPLYDWFHPNSVDWWENAVGFLLETVDVVRLDHFRAIDTYWKIPQEWASRKKNALEGYWGKGPGHELLKALQMRLHQGGRLPSAQLPLIAEDLGFLDPLYASPEEYPKDWNPKARYKVDTSFRILLEDNGPSLQPAFDIEKGEYSTRIGVDHLMEEYGLPFMAVAHFGFDGSDRHNPETAAKDCVLYTGTHDNDTTLGWYLERTKKAVEEACEKRKKHKDALKEGLEKNEPPQGEENGERPQEDPDLIQDVLGKVVHIDKKLPQYDVVWELIEMTLHSDAALAGAPMQDILGLGTEARMNLPGDQSREWWNWRMKPEQSDYSKLTEKISDLLNRTHRRE
ncbi:MAG: 4-alpha-glucanotransferase [Candidatus Sumerlaeia bacterium]